jgi:hypothetical protein
MWLAQIVCKKIIFIVGMHMRPSMYGIVKRFSKEEAPMTNKLTYCNWMNRNKSHQIRKENVLLC